MAIVKGPNGVPFELDDVVASGLVGSPSGDYEYVKADPKPKSKK